MRCNSLAVAALFVGLAGARGADMPGKDADVRKRDARALAKRIDDLLGTGWQAAKVQPAPLADDAEFLRRVSIDLAGRIPTVAEARAFLDSKAPDKREQ